MRSARPFAMLLAAAMAAVAPASALAQARSRSMASEWPLVSPVADETPRLPPPGYVPPGIRDPGIIRRVPIAVEPLPAPPAPAVAPGLPDLPSPRPEPFRPAPELKPTMVPYTIPDERRLGLPKDLPGFPKEIDSKLRKLIVPTARIGVRAILPAGVGAAEPVDTRVAVDSHDLDSLPFSAIGQLSVQHTSGATQFGTGFLIAPGVVMTAAHVLHSHEHGPAVNVTFTSSCLQGVASRESTRVQTVGRSRVRVTRRWGEGDDSIEGDYGIVLLPDAPWHKACGTLVPTEVEPAFVERHARRGTDRFMVIGYPFDKPAGSMWLGRGGVLASPGKWVKHLIDTMKGQSGAPLVAILNDPASGRNVAHAIGIHSRESAWTLQYNVARRIDRQMLAEIRSWRDVLEGDAR